MTTDSRPGTPLFGASSESMLAAGNESASCQEMRKQGRQQEFKEDMASGLLSWLFSLLLHSEDVCQKTSHASSRTLDQFHQSSYRPVGQLFLTKLMLLEGRPEIHQIMLLQALQEGATQFE